MNIKIEFSMDGAAFDGDAVYAEAGGLIRTIADKIATGRTDGPVIDSNGNTVGRFAIVEEG
jgi:hypothetical protein